jgi:hypothetical protein
MVRRLFVNIEQIVIQHGHVTDEKSKVLKISRKIDQSSIFHRLSF